MRRLVAVLAALWSGVAGPTAHPLGNFSVNQYDGLTLSADGVRVSAVVNTAEIPTRQDRLVADADGDGTMTDVERTAYAAKAFGDLAAAFEVVVDGRRLTWTVSPGEYRYGDGAGGLPTARLTCALAAATRVDRPTTATVANHYRGDRVGWHEMTAVGEGLRLVDSPLPGASVSDELRAYPNVDAPTKVMDVRTATLRLEPGVPAPLAVPANRPGSSDFLAAATSWAERRFQNLAAGSLTPTMAVLAVLLALLLGAGHAALPGTERPFSPRTSRAGRAVPATLSWSARRSPSPIRPACSSSVCCSRRRPRWPVTACSATSAW